MKELTPPPAHPVVQWLVHAVDAANIEPNVWVEFGQAVELLQIQPPLAAKISVVGENNPNNPKTTKKTGKINFRRNFLFFKNIALLFVI